MYFQIITALLALITSLVGLATAVISYKSKTKENYINKQPSKTSITVKGHDNVLNNNSDNTSFNNTTYNQSTINQYLAKSDDDGSIVYLISCMLPCFQKSSSNIFRHHIRNSHIVCFDTDILQKFQKTYCACFVITLFYNKLTMDYFILYKS